MKLKDIAQKYSKDALKIHKNLNNKIWQNETIKPRILNKLKLITDKCVKFNKIEQNIVDVIMIGSSCDVNYTEKSDIDIHLVLDLNEDSDEYKIIVLQCKDWNRNNFLIFNHKVEVNPQPTDSKTISKNAAQYSIKHNKWLKKPNYDFEITDEMYEEIDNTVKEIINQAHKCYKEKDGNKLHQIIKKLKDERRKSVATEGELSIPNLVFKTLRYIGCIDEWKDRIIKFEVTELLNRG
ncbi:MAG: hypothetical protein KDH96_02365 [Candidatus Riesia sp.]|nr:hypothetical protein [Candidatus Riesia sp.]